MNTEILDQALVRYRDRLSETRAQEIYKWQATKHFHDTFNVNAENLAANIDASLSEANNLLTSVSWFPKGMLVRFAEEFPSETKAAIERLFKESIDLRSRMVEFVKWGREILGDSNELALQRGEGITKNHYQDTRSMSVYLAFNNPAEHYLYKATMYTFVADALGLSHPGNKFDKVFAYREMCDEILAYLESEHPDIIEQSDATLSNELRAIDPNHHLLVQDIVYFMSTYDRESYESTDDSKAGNDALGDADVETVRYWLYAPGHGADMWEDFYARGVMGLGWDELGDLSAYASKQEIRDRLREIHGGGSSFSNSALATWQFVHELKPGDVIFAKRGMSEIIGRGVVEGDYEYDPEDSDYPHLRSVRWTDKGSWKNVGTFAMKTLTEVTDYTDFVTKTKELFSASEDEEVDEPAVTKLTPYGKDDFLSQVFMSESQYDTLVGVLRSMKNIILQGAPGVGKTFAAKRLAYSMMGVKDPERVMMVQFHQSYSYEDFIEGFRPTEDGKFKLSKGAFYSFCKRAQDDSDNDYFFIIDEINRGNLSKIFGELFMLIESDKRGQKNKLQLLYSRELFYVPGNVYLIGMMNTADRSLAMLDYALRRRFAFFDLRPGFDSDGFRAYREGLGSKKFDDLIACVGRLNEAIADDDTLGEGFCIGHSYFCGLKPEDVTDEKLSAIVEFELVPMLREYWFDEPSKVREWTDALRRAVK